MRTRMLGLMMTVGLLMGALAVPAAAQGQGQSQGKSQGNGCAVIGQNWSWWAQQGPDYTITIYVDEDGNPFFFGADGDLIDNDGNVVDEDDDFVDDFDQFEVNISTGTWTSEVASSGHAPDPYPVDPGPGVYSRVLAAYCSGDLPL